MEPSPVWPCVLSYAEEIARLLLDRLLSPVLIRVVCEPGRYFSVIAIGHST